jgi:hypothetical protein
VLDSVACVLPDDCVAVGYSLAGVLNGLGRGALVDAWNGSSWSSQSTPPLAGQVELHSVSCTSVSNCVAVGLQSPLMNGADQPLIERWNGATWTVDPQASSSSLYPPCATACTDLSFTLAGVACASGAACQAVGSATTAEQGTATFGESWNGTSWGTSATANPTPGAFERELTAVSCTGPADCLAVSALGSPAFAERWNGTGWSIQGTYPTPGASPSGVSCASRSQCEIVGYQLATRDAPARPQAWLFNGLGWAAQVPPGPSNASLESVACPAVSDCFAVGATSNQLGPTNYPLSAPLIDRFG